MHFEGSLLVTLRSWSVECTNGRSLRIPRNLSLLFLSPSVQRLLAPPWNKHSKRTCPPDALLSYRFSKTLKCHRPWRPRKLYSPSPRVCHLSHFHILLWKVLASGKRTHSFPLPMLDLFRLRKCFLQPSHSNWDESLSLVHSHNPRSLGSYPGGPPGSHQRTGLGC